MRTLSLESSASPTPRWLWLLSTLGVLWNVFGVYQFAGTFTAAGQAAMTAGMTAAQANVYLSLPAWVSMAFAIGVFGGLVGSIALVGRRRLSEPTLAVSLVGYILLFAGDVYYGVFAAIPSQLIILAIVVIIAIVLLWASRSAAQRGLLR
jgi:hypothetical protein